METANQIPSVGDLLSKSWGIFVKHIRTVAVIVLLVYGPINLILTLAPGMGGGDQTDWASIMAYARFNGLYELLIGSFSFILIAGLVKSAEDGVPVDFKSLWSTRFNGAIYIRYIWTTFVKGLLAGLLFLLLIVPGVIYSVYWLFAEYVAVFENEGGLKAMDASRALVRGRWWRVLWISIAGFFVSVAMGMAAALGLEMLDLHWTVSVLSSFITDLAAAFYVIYLGVAYRSMKGSAV